MLIIIVDQQKGLAAVSISEGSLTLNAFIVTDDPLLVFTIIENARKMFSPDPLTMALMADTLFRAKLRLFADCQLNG